MPDQQQHHAMQPLESRKVVVQLPRDVPLADQVVITFCDCCAAGLQVVHALQASTSGSSVQRHSATLTGGLQLRPVLCDSAASDAAAPFQLVNIMPPGNTKPQVTYVCINSALQSQQVADVVAALINWLQDIQAQHTGASMPPVIVAAAARLQPSPGIKLPHSELYTLAFNGAAVPGGLTSAAELPPSLRLQDAFLAALVHGLYVVGLPTVCLLVPGYKPSASGGMQDSLESVQSLASALAAARLLGDVTYSRAAVSNLKLLHRWFAGSDTTQGVGETLYV